MKRKIIGKTVVAAGMVLMAAAFSLTACEEKKENKETSPKQKKTLIKPFNI